MSRSFPSYGVEHSKEAVRYVNGATIEETSPRIFDHFAYGAGAMNSHVPQNWVTTETGAATQFAPGATGATVAIGATGGTTNNAQEIAGKLVGWKPSTMATNRPLVLEVRAKFVGTTTATDGDFTIGFADAVTYTNGLAYVVSAASALTTSVPTEFCGFYYSSIPTSGALYGASGNVIGAVTTIADVNTVTGSTVVKDSDMHVYRIEIDASGNAQFYIDGTHRMTVASAVTPTVALTPYIAIIAKNSHVHTGTIDYIHVSAGIG